MTKQDFSQQLWGKQDLNKQDLNKQGLNKQAQKKHTGAAGGLRRIDLSRATGCNLETIRYYEKIGVMGEPERDKNGYRNYNRDDVLRLGFVMRARDLGFSLAEVKELLALVDRGIQTCAGVQIMAQKHLDDVSAKIKDLQQVQKVLSTTLSQCSGKEIPQCAVIDALAPDIVQGI